MSSSLAPATISDQPNGHDVVKADASDSGRSSGPEATTAEKPGQTSARRDTMLMKEGERNDEEGKTTTDDGSKAPISKLKTQSTFSSNRSTPNSVPRKSGTYASLHDGRNIGAESSSADAPKEKKKAVSFFSRLLPGSNSSKKRSSTLTSRLDVLENDSEPESAQLRQDSMDRPLATQEIDNIEYAPRVPQPPSYVKVKFKNRKERDLNRLFLAQELHPTPRNADLPASSRPERGKAEDHDAIWALGFSKDGRYLASAGQDQVVRIWAVLATPEERTTQDLEDADDDTEGSFHFKAHVFKSVPVREYSDHEGPVLDLSWSKNNFILTTSLDKTIRLYHPSRPECLCTFKHSSAVHAIAFHPRDDRFFLAGSKDAKLRLWSIPDKRVEFWANVNGDTITAIAFSPDGKTAFAGTSNGTISIFGTDSLKYISQFNVRSKRKSRVLGIETRYIPEDSETVKLLVTTADSRIGVYNLRDKALEIKLKSHKAEDICIRASFSDDAQYVVTGSEDKQVYLWNISEAAQSTNDRDRALPRPLEYFEASPSSKVNCAILAPRETRIVLSASADPIFDICNPPPVRLVEREGSIASSRITENGGHRRSQSRHTIAQGPSEQTPGTGTPRSATFPDDAKPSASYSTRTMHPCGPIVVTTTLSGAIRIFRQDCAFTKRRAFTADESSVRRLYLRRALGGVASSRSSTIGGGTPGQAQSRRSYASSLKSARTGTASLAGGNTGPVGGSGGGAMTQSDHRGEMVARTRRSGSEASQPSRDRIERWREGVDGRGSAASLRTGGSVSSFQRGSMSELPQRGGEDVGSERESLLRHDEQGRRPRPSSDVRAMMMTRADDADDDDNDARANDDDDDAHDEDGDDETDLRRTSTQANPLRLQGAQSFMFWNTSQYTPLPRGEIIDATGFPGLGQKVSKESVASRLTSEELEALHLVETEDKGPKCTRCGEETFVAKGPEWGMSFGMGKSAVICANCGWEKMG